MASWRPLPGVVRSRRAVTVSLVLSSCRRYQPRGAGRGPALEGCSEEVGVADGGRCEGGVPWVGGGWAGWAARVLRVYVDVSLALAWLGRAGRCWVASWVRDGPLGAVVVSWRPADGDWGRLRGGEWVSGRLRHARHGNG